MSDRVPSYRRHKKTGRGIVTLPDGLGRRRDVLLTGKYGTKESRQDYDRVIAEWLAAGRRLPQSTADAEADITINELALAFWQHAEKHYRHADGTPTGELNDYKYSLRPLRALYGHKPARDFGPLALEAVRNAMITGSYLTEKEKEERRQSGRQTMLSRGVINQRVGRIRRLFRWAVAKEMVPSSVLHGLEAVRGLERGRSDAREREPVRPVPVAFVEATLPFLTPTVADMVMLQLVTGARPGEICNLRACDVDMSGKVWIYRPSNHKTAHRNKTRAVPIGPRGQEIIRRRLKPNVEAFLFSPAEAVQEKRERDNRERKTKRYPSEAARVAGKKACRPKVWPGDQYNSVAYAIAIRRAIVRANKAGQTIPHWHPHQLRHTQATLIRREFGIDAARATLGHASPVVTEVYAELDLGKAIDVAAKLG